MSKVEKEGHQNFSKFDNVSTEALEAFLQADFDAPEAEQADIDTIIYISSLLAKRNKAANIPQKDVATAKAEFFEKYYPMKDDPLSLYDFGDDDDDTADDVKPVAQSKPAVKKTAMFYLRRTVSVAMIVLMLTFGGTVTASALGYNPWQTIAEWSDELFWFSSASPTAELQQTLADYGFVGNIVPTWLPDGYKYDSLEIDNQQYKYRIVAIFTKRFDDYSEEISITVKQYEDISKSTLAYEKDAEDVFVYNVGNIDYYTMTNLGLRNIIWQYANIECCISGNFTQDEAIRMVDSISYGE